MICPDCRMPTWPAVEHECGRNEWRVMVVRDGVPDYQAEFTTNPHMVDVLARTTRKAYSREVAKVVIQRRWVDGWSVVDDPAPIPHEPFDIVDAEADQ